MGLEPTTFSLQGNCAPNCATAPCQTAVLQSGRSDTSMCYTFPFEVTAHRELLCRTLHSYSTAGCEFSLTRYPQRLSSLLYHRAILPRKPRWSSHGDSNSDFHLERVVSQPVRGWDDVSRILPQPARQPHIRPLRQVRVKSSRQCALVGQKVDPSYGQRAHSQTPLFSCGASPVNCFTLFATSALTEKANSGVFSRLLPNKHNSTLTMLQLPKPPRFVILAYLKSLWLLCANS